MSWSNNDYPDAMKNLDADVRRKAIEVANSLLEDGYDEGRAIAIAIDTAKGVTKTSDVVYHIVTHEKGWAVKREGADQPSNVYSTKEEALNRGDELLENYNATLKVHRQDGTLERTKKTTS